jgi:hypothetical protein
MTTSSAALASTGAADRPFLKRDLRSAIASELRDG